MSYVKAPDQARIDELHEKFGRFFLTQARAAEEKERMLAAIEECRWESPITEYTREQHTVLDVLQYLVERA